MHEFYKKEYFSLNDCASTGSMCKDIINIWEQMYMKNNCIVIIGGTRGIGFALADSFLKLGCNVVICGRTKKGIQEALLKLDPARSGNVVGTICDVTDPEQIQKLWDYACKQFQKVDIWINNAGVSISDVPAWGNIPDQVNAIIDTNIKGTLNGVHVAVTGMLQQGFGSVYNLEGLGSEGGMHIKGESLYAITKAALRYYDDSLAMELKGAPIICGAIQPGMVMTDLVLAGYKQHPEKLDRVRFVFNTIGSLPEQVAPVLAHKILANRKNGARIRYSSRPATFLKFFLAPFRKRDIVSEAMRR